MIQKSEQNIRATVANEAGQGRDWTRFGDHLIPGLRSKSHKMVERRWVGFRIGSILGAPKCADL